MATPPVRLLPDPDQHELLAQTLERVNRAANGARARLLESGVHDVAGAGASGPGRAGIRAVVKEELDRFKLPSPFVAPSVERVVASLRRQKFSTYQSLTLPASALKWGGADRVTLPTWAGRRTVRAYVDPLRGGLRPPLEGRAVTLVYRNGEFELVAAG